MSTVTMTTDRVKKFKSRTIFQVDVENLKSECNFKKPLLIKISSTIHCKRPILNDDSSFYIVYSPQTFNVRPKEKNLLNLQFKIEKPKHIEWTIGLLPSYSNKLSIENTEQIARIKDNFIVLNLLNKDFSNSFTIRTYQEIGYIFLNNQKSYEKVITEYELI